MSTFCNDKDNTALIGFTHIDEDKTGDCIVKTEDIIDSVGEPDHNICNKMGSSIPNLFSRMFLFGSAYSEIRKELDKSNKSGSTIDKETVFEGPMDTEGKGSRVPNVYHYIISEHLDLLEFIFIYGEDIKVVPWNKEQAEQEMQNQDVPVEIRELDTVLMSTINNTPSLKEMRNLHLLFYKSTLIGGTSPLVLVYTNPNIVDDLKDYKTNFFKEDSDVAYVKPLYKRSEDFRRLMYLLLKNGKFHTRDNGNDNLKDFREYVDGCMKHFDKKLSDEIEHEKEKEGGRSYQEQTNAIAQPITEKIGESDEPIETPITGSRLFRAVQRPVEGGKFRSDYKIAPTTAREVWEKDGDNDKLVTEPLILKDGGISQNAYYYNDVKWDPTIHKVPNYATIEKMPLSRRKLPGIEKMIPFLTADDLLEDKIIRLAYFVDKNKFFTGYAGNMMYLLPLKRRIFRVFTMESIAKMLSVRIITEGDEDDPIESVAVSLSIPMKTYKDEVKLTRTYSKKKGAQFQIVDLNKSIDAFNLGIFPFYRVQDPDVKNYYDIMVGYAQNVTKVQAFRFGDFLNPLTPLAEGDRCQQHPDITAHHIRLGETFDFLEVEVAGARGLVIPKMQEITAGSKKFVFAVDFGTSNTHIVCSSESNRSRPEPLTIGDADSQVAYLLAKVDKRLGQTNKFSQFAKEAAREFVPMRIGLSDNHSFPMRTAIYEREKLSAGERKEVFCHFNIGFNFQNEQQEVDNRNDYVLDIKWSTDQLAKERMQAYCEQLLWIMHNKTMLNGGSPDFKVIITYPQVMGYNKLMTAWGNAQTIMQLGDQITNDSFKLESLAPYRGLRDAGKINCTDVFVNVDIGGGSTDIYYLNPNQRGKQGRSYSVDFAANVLWGEGIDKDRGLRKENGFVKVFQDAVKGDFERYKEYKKVAKDASDMVSYLFAQKDAKFAQKISAHAVSDVMVTHFAAIIYYLVLVLKTEGGLTPPKSISFTGMGSKYLSMITMDGFEDALDNAKIAGFNQYGQAGLDNAIKTGNKRIAGLVKTIFKLAGYPIDNIEINRSPNPKEVTAEGAFFLSDSKPDEKDIPSNKNTLHGISAEEESGAKITVADLDDDKVREDALTQLSDFIEMLGQPDFKEAVNDARDGVLPFDIKKLCNAGLNSRDNLLSSFALKKKLIVSASSDKGTVVSSALFFWPLLDTLYKVANNLASEQS